MLFRVLVGFVLLTSASTSHAYKDWKIVDQTENAVLRVDMSSILSLPSLSGKRPFAVRQVWASFESGDVRKEMLLSFNCATNQSHMLVMVETEPVYDEYGDGLHDSTSFYRYDDLADRYKSLPSGSIGETIAEVACE